MLAEIQTNQTLTWVPLDYSSDELQFVKSPISQAIIDQPEITDPNSFSLKTFLDEFGHGLFDAAVAQNQPVYKGQINPKYQDRLKSLTRSLYEPQEKAVGAVMELLVNEKQPAAIINGEMGTGKTMMSIAISSLMHDEGFKRTMVLCPPHLVYKWRREILATVPNARVWILNGPDTLLKLVQFRQLFNNNRGESDVPEYFIMGRIRMRMGYHWRISYYKKYEYQYVKKYDEEGVAQRVLEKQARFTCPCCGKEIRDQDGKLIIGEAQLRAFLSEERRFCKEELLQKKDASGKLLEAKRCNTPLWTLCRKDSEAVITPEKLVFNQLIKLPTIGEKTAHKLIDTFGSETVADILEKNVMAFANLLDHQGNFVFTDAQARRLERALGNVEFSVGQGGYQATEYIKRYLPKNYFGFLIVDEAHEYKNYGTAQGQAMGVLCRCVNKILALTGTLMGGYAEDIFYLLWRLNPRMMMEDGFSYNKSRSLGSASMAFMREYGVLKETIRTGLCDESGSFTSSKAKRSTVSISKAPGFSPLAIIRYILPITVFVKLSEFGEGILPEYDEIFRSISLSEEQENEYRQMENRLMSLLRSTLKKGDTSLTSTVINALLSWPETCYEDLSLVWKRKDKEIYSIAKIVDELTPTPKEADVIDVIKQELAQGRKVLVYTVYSGIKDTATRLKNLLKNIGIKAAVLKASVKSEEREDWVAEQLDKGVQVVICNPELVKTGLDLLEFPSIYFMTTGYNVYTLMQAARRSWRIGQTENVRVYFGGYDDSAQETCLKLMAQKISVTQSTSGDMPECGLDILNESSESVEVELARKLMEKKAA
ncbi:SNF2-related protein [Neisseria sp. Ec49-e6-T10]|uniref:SNF2-related protein n=1 Tax=Neisseria sp. Ec49-e6-T10 TaxID=3140744 RepID=UPI003EB9331F